MRTSSFAFARAALVLSGFVSMPIAACGGAPVPAARPARASGQSALMDDTFAGKNKCNASQHDRPFVIEWDATDASSFQARAATDVVFVKYQGCNLTVIDSCNDDSVRGLYGAYKPIDWTSGAVEKVDVENTADLYAKLPLGAALLGGRVEAGEKFHMEYFVSGTRTATRPAIYKADLAKNPGCNGVTHFVYAYNLGAFALGSRAKIQGEVGGTVWGAGAGGGSKYQSAIEKKGGELDSCRAESAKEIDTCKVPVRLTLREITDGESPTAQAAQAPETPDALNLAGKLQATSDAERKAQEHMTSAQQKLGAGDGRGCLAELDEHDRLDPRALGLSTSPRGAGALRAMCLMASGQCDAGKATLRKAYEATQARAKPEDIDRMVDSMVSLQCRGGWSTDRDRFLRAIYVLTAQNERVSAAECQAAYEMGKRALPNVRPTDERDMVSNPYNRLAEAPGCFARAGDCAAAWRVAKETKDALEAHAGGAADDRRRRAAFMSATQRMCIGKDQGKLTDAEQVERAIAELSAGNRDEARPAGYCAARVEQGLASLARARASGPVEGDLKWADSRLVDGVADCESRGDDCAEAWRLFAKARKAFSTEKDADLGARAAFRDKVRQCRLKPQGAMSPRETAFWATGALEDLARGDGAPTAEACRATYDALKRAVDASGGDKSANTEWDYGTREARRNAPACFARARDCATAWSVYKEIRGRLPTPYKSDREKPEAELRKGFERDLEACKGK